MRFLLGLLALLTLAGAAPVDWTRTVTVAPNGAFVIGNTTAPVRLVEYLSYTCSHCAEFAAQSARLKSGYVANGSVAIELRNAVRDRLDFTAALAARCGGAAKFAGNHAALFAAQTAIIAQAERHGRTAAGKAMAAMEPNAGLKAIARNTGLGALMARRGVSPAQLDACLIDATAQNTVIDMTNEAWQTRRLPGTPAFLINDTLVPARNWAGLEPHLRTAVATARNTTG